MAEGNIKEPSLDTRITDAILPFDADYERERMWHKVYEPMRQEMLRKYRPHSRLIKEGEQTTIFDFLEEGDTENDRN